MSEIFPDKYIMMTVLSQNKIKFLLLKRRNEYIITGIKKMNMGLDNGLLLEETDYFTFKTNE